MRWVILAFLFVLGIINFADKAVAGLAAVPIMEEFNLSFTEWGLVGSSFYWVFSIAGVIGAALSDRIGTKKILAFMAITWTVVQFGAYAITGLPLLILSRILLGIGEGPFYATAVSQLNKWFPPESRGLPLSIMNFGSTVGAVATAPILVAIIQTNGWRVAYAVLGVTSLVWLVLWLSFGKEKPEDHSTPVKQTASKQTPSFKKIKWPEISAALLSRVFIFTCFAMFASYWIIAYSLVWIPSYLVQVKGFTQAEMGNIVGIVGILSGVGYILISWFSDRLYKKNESIRKSRVFVAGFALIASGFLFYAMTMIQSNAMLFIVLCLAQAMAYSMYALGPIIVNSLLPNRAGLMTGVLNGFATTAGIVGSFATGKLIQSGTSITLGFNHSILLAAGLLLVCGVMLLIFVNPKKGIDNAQHLLNEDDSISV